MHIDLNADVGESYGAWAMGDDESLVPLVSSANVACGAHAGDPLVMQRTVELAKRHGAAVGAHPGYADRDGFGRRELELPAEELRASLLYQLGALDAFCRLAGVQMHHVKPHGALYNRAARDGDLARTVAQAVHEFDARLVLVGLAGSLLLEAGREAGLAVAAEAFADRAYEPDGSLGRFEHGAGQAVSIATLNRLTAYDGTTVEVRAETICLHGDTPGAAEYARQVRMALEQAGVTVAPLGRK
jgi:5-oxoprolinase (ATP-hydrolysing) subunit A